MQVCTLHLQLHASTEAGGRARHTHTHVNTLYTFTHIYIYTHVGGQASMNTVEFSLREFNTGGFPKGLSLMLAVMPNWLQP